MRYRCCCLHMENSRQPSMRYTFSNHNIDEIVSKKLGWTWSIGLDVGLGLTAERY